MGRTLKFPLEPGTYCAELIELNVMVDDNFVLHVQQRVAIQLYADDDPFILNLNSTITPNPASGN